MNRTRITALIAVGILCFGSAAQGGTPGTFSRTLTPIKDAAQAVAQMIDAQVNNVAKRFNIDLSQWTQTSATQGNFFGSNDKGSIATYTDANGDTMTLAQCSNGYYGKQTQTVCASAPNACGMTGSGFVAEFYSYDPHGKLSSHTVSPCSALTPANSLCGSTNPGGTSGTGAGSHAGTATVTPVTTTCTPHDVCSGNSVMHVNADCSQTLVRSCVAPLFCSPGSSVCMPGNVHTAVFNDSAGASLDGSLVARPTLVQHGASTKLFWNVTDAVSCAISDGTSVLSQAFTSGADGFVTPPLVTTTVYTLHCVGAQGSVPARIDQSATVNIIPAFQEQ